MDVKQFLSSTLSSIWLPIMIGLLGLGAVAYGFFSFSTPSTSDEVIIESGGQAQAQEEEVESLFIDVSGAVASPGVYELSAGARVQDGVSAAGGMRKDADRFAVAKSINMASKVSDGMKLYIPFEGEDAILTTVTNGNSAAVAGISSSLININSASQSLLEELSGIGPVTAKKIIDNRPYSSVDDLLAKKVVGQSVFEKIKEQVSVN